jgi:hypothetical protein
MPEIQHASPEKKKLTNTLNSLNEEKENAIYSSQIIAVSRHLFKNTNRSTRDL